MTEERLQDYAPQLYTFTINLTDTETEAIIASGYLTDNPMTYECAVLQGIVQQIKEQI